MTTSPRDDLVWLHMRIDRLLTVDRGRDVIVLDRDSGGEYLVGLSEQYAKQMKAALTEIAQ
jgi:hypothetical protein